MRRISSIRRAWPVRLLGAAAFAVGAAALAHAADGGGPAARSPQVRPSVFRPSIALRPDGLPIDPSRSARFDRTTIDVSAGPWTPQAIYSMLAESGLGDWLGDALTVRVTAAFPPTRLVWSGGHATMWLDAWPGSQFTRQPDRTLAHLIGLVWAAHHADPTFWNEYLSLRGIKGEPRLGSSRIWRREEILADDYRLLFGSDAAIAQLPRHENPGLADPRPISRLREFLIAAAS